MKSQNLNLLLSVETLKNGSVAASILEFPHYRVEAPTKEEAITQLQTQFVENLSHTEVISWDVSLPISFPAWQQFSGVFEHDLDFQEIMETIRAERNSDDETEVDPSYYL